MIHLELAGGQKASWDGLLDIAHAYPRGWTIVGGQLTFLHLVERRFGNPRPTADMDAAIDVRGHHPDAVQRFVAAMRRVGFEPAGISPDGYQHRWVRGEAQIDILIPSGLDPHRSDGNRKEPGRVTTIESRGLQFAINRSSATNVMVNGRAGTINAPDLLGAIYGKCSALLHHQDRNISRHLADIVMLASVTQRGDRSELRSLTRRELLRLRTGLTRATDDDAITIPAGTSAAQKARTFLVAVNYIIDTQLDGSSWRTNP